MRHAVMVVGLRDGTMTQDGTVTPPPPPTLQSFTLEQSPARLRVTDSRGCTTTITR